jgi:hypothetical protein
MEQRLSLLQIERVEAFGEPAVDRSEEIEGLIALALISPEPRHAHRRAPGPVSHSDVEDWLGKKDREASRLQADTLWWAYSVCTTLKSSVMLSTVGILAPLN